MATYCQQGDTARVTLADGSIYEYSSNLPINVDVNVRDDIECTRVNVQYAYTTINNSGATGGGSGSINAQMPIGGVRISPTDNKRTEIYSRGAGSTVSCVAPGWYLLLALSVFSAFRFTSVWITGITNGYRIIITDSLGNQLLNKIVTNPNYDVECIENCPPNTLDCGDCCLPCDSVFNEISSIRALVKGLK